MNKKEVLSLKLILREGIKSLKLMCFSNKEKNVGVSEISKS
jgi:hypothetical protein